MSSFEEVVAILSLSMLNSSNRHRDRLKCLRMGIFTRHALICIRFLRQVWTPKTEDKDGNIFVSDLSHLLAGQVWPHICPTFVSFPNAVKLIISSSVSLQ